MNLGYIYLTIFSHLKYKTAHFPVARFSTAFKLIFLLLLLKRTVLKVIDFPRYNTKGSGENEILLGTFRVVSRIPLHFVLYLGNFDYFLDSVPCLELRRLFF